MLKLLTWPALGPVGGIFNFIESPLSILWSHHNFPEKKIFESSVKKFWNDFLEISYSSEYWPENYDLYFQWKLKWHWTDYWCFFKIWIGKIEKIKIAKNNIMIFEGTFQDFSSGKWWMSEEWAIASWISKDLFQSAR